MAGRMPDFLGLGVQKGGTTTLQRLLEQHPDVHLPLEKELQYFSLHFDKPQSWYTDHFRNSGHDQCCGEITPYYLFHPQVAQRVHDVLPRVKLLVLLRDPVDRTLSQYFHSRRLGLEPLDLKSALAAEADRLEGADYVLEMPSGRHRSHQEHSYLSRSRYEQQLPRWLSKFPSDQILVMRSEDLFANPKDVWDRVLRFLELLPFDLPQVAVVANAGLGEASLVEDQIRFQLREQLEPTYSWAFNHFQFTW